MLKPDIILVPNIENTLGKPLNPIVRKNSISKIIAKVPITLAKKALSSPIAHEASVPKEKPQEYKIQSLVSNKPNNPKTEKELIVNLKSTKKTVEVKKPLLPTPTVRESSSGSSTPRDSYCDYKNSHDNLSDTTPPGRSPATVLSHSRSRHNSNSSSTSSRSPKVIQQVN